MRRFLLPALLAALCVSAQAAVHSVDVGAPLPRFGLLKPGIHHYLRYIRTADGANAPVDIWTREVRFDERDGMQRLHIVQRWDGAMVSLSAPGTVRRLDSWFETGSFRPLSHVRILEKDGKKTVEGFVFGPDRVSGMQDLADNTQKALSVASSEPSFNFETDIEFLQALPLAEGYEASINFYHPGGPAPKRYSFKVSGSDTIAGPAGAIDCWVVTTDYGTPGADAKFWFAKGSQVMVRQESAPRDGRVMVKALID
ncbi:hypothetical protein AB595_06960 [Massilia sp. WF1]|uniref:DUF3108 domain-containing protein n=1 Tax=unclassified Massilia TaxID=2609279 RepID=UPI00064A0C49|nr:MULTISPECIES: hypothetical protein [unclassified Massilia]ALK98377.1 hypothetical protein AM586_21490 [Massilia sp. WG5]KLU37045.1 hypothetical protein AB595_06960 [Massilia sp. WF1]